MRRTRLSHALFPLAVTSLAHAATYVVNTNSDPAGGAASNCSVGNINTCTLRDAIAAAIGGDAVSFAPSVTNIQLTSGNPFDLADTSGSVVTIDGGGAVTLDGNHTTRVFDAGGNTKTLITGLTIQNGQAPASQSGGAVRTAGALTIANSMLSGSSAQNGGGIFNNGTLTITHSTVSGNASTGGSGSGGGGIFSTGGTLYITDSTVSGNYSNAAGGGILGSGGGFVTTLTLSNSTVSGNTSRYNGGGIENFGGTITNSTVANNVSKFTNGGGFFNNGTLILLNCTLSGNTDHTNGNNGVVSSGGASIEFGNTIISDGCSGAGSVIDNGGNLDGGTSCGFSAPSSTSTANLNLGPLQNNGGPTQTMLPGAGSDAINFTVCTNAPLADQRNFLRPDPASVGQANLAMWAQRKWARCRRIASMPMALARRLFTSDEGAAWADRRSSARRVAARPALRPRSELHWHTAHKARSGMVVCEPSHGQRNTKRLGSDPLPPVTRV